ncbi:hypothetical protein F2Q68_00014883 [Brassica cretica]|uniref:Uncharacterized protein n=1 Tax=Brassica cretica TaxID=69181 RepID=A0A8S9HIB0_BRACR|nr:hypothetical protein F2Q68_00014883 [Brassica cretica]
MEDSSVAIQSLQGDLLRGQSKADLDALTSQLCEEKNNALAMEKEIKALRLKTKPQRDVRGGRRGDSTKLAPPYSTATLGLVTTKHPSPQSRGS